MTTYIAPIREMRFVIEELAGLDETAALPGFEELTPELTEAILEEAGKLAAEVLAPLNKPGDEQRARLNEGRVLLPEGFAEAYQTLVKSGWNGLSVPSDYGGQGLPELLGIATHEMWNSANLAFALCPLLSASASEVLIRHGTEQQKTLYLPRLVSGEWTGTMNLTEPQAGSDLSAVRTQAVPEGDHYRLFGQKIFITWGEHELADNILHLVLARTPDAPEGVKGISLFLAPKYPVNPDGTLGGRNEIYCLSLEHKLGIHASPTCVLAYGDRNGAIGYLVGQENAGLDHMFTMMNGARLMIGLQGLAIAERAYQQARAFAKERIQGRPIGLKHGRRIPIIQHPDVRRMLMTMKAQIEAMRALCYTTAMRLDLVRHHPEPKVCEAHQTQLELLIPVVKGWCTELGFEIASTGVQVHGGMGYIEETGASQYLRDARITSIYEGTTGIQAKDLVGRKLRLDDGAAMRALIAEMRKTLEALKETVGNDLVVIARSLEEGVQALEKASDWMLTALKRSPYDAFAASVSYLMLTGYVCGGWQMARAGLVARRSLFAHEEPRFYEAKVVTARFYCEQILPKAGALLKVVQSGGTSVKALDDEQFWI